MRLREMNAFDRSGGHIIRPEAKAKSKTGIFTRGPYYCNPWLTVRMIARTDWFWQP